MKTVFSFFLFFCGFISLSFGQVAFMDGYVITNRSDTLYGKIKNVTPAQRSLQIVFSNAASKERIKYKPFQIKGYYLDGQAYESKIYDIDPALTHGYGVFMEKANDGTVKVYYYWNTNKDRGFTQTYLENDGDYLQPVDFFGFKKQMTKYFEDFPQLQSKIQRGTFKKKDLLKIVAEYNDWKENSW